MNRLSPVFRPRQLVCLGSNAVAFHGVTLFDEVMLVKKDNVTRFSVSLPESLFHELDAMVQARGFQSRSQALAEMISQQLVQHRQEYGDEIMAGTITLVYNNLKRDVHQKLWSIQYRHVKEIISSQHVHLERQHSLEVLLVQGPAATLKEILDELSACKGVTHAKLDVTSHLLPPLH
jgi:CopG family transcriptional regulator, nickel-responsive regulator